MSEESERDAGRAMRRGACLRCPSCGEGHLLRGYLKVVETCPACGEDLSPQRTDDGPAYLTILIVGHLMAPLMLWVFMAYRPGPWAMVTGFTIGCVVLSLALLPVMKGVLVGFQWAKRMHGFGEEPAEV